MAYGWKNIFRDAQITPEDQYLKRRQLLAGGAAFAGSVLLGQAGHAATENLEPNSWDDITSYNNFYEFGTGKDDPKRNAHLFNPTPWSIKIDGLVEKPGAYPLEDILTQMTIEERIYRFRCVEAWSMVVPWNGFELRDLLNLAGIKSGAKYVAFETIIRPKEMPGQRSKVLDWPYVEGLRLDEAMHPLTLMATGIYGKPMPVQNGAPLRLVVPWKYGFKSIKSISRITLTDKEPPTSWNKANSREYGFYSNVNPKVSHPRWSQSSERRIGAGLFARREPTLMFNGYTDEVASLYSSMDLKVHF